MINYRAAERFLTELKSLRQEVEELQHDPLVEEARRQGVSEINERQRVEAALRESEKRYKQLLDSVTDYIYTVKLENGQPVATTHGPNCVAVTGYTWQEYDADPQLWYRMIHPQDRQAVTAHLAKLLAGEATPPFEHRLIHKDGSVRWVRNTTVLHRNEQGQCVSYDGLISDITTSKQLRERLDAIYQLGDELTLLRDKTLIINRVLETVLTVLRVQGASYGEVDETAHELEYYFRASRDAAQQPHLTSRLSLGEYQTRGIGVAVVRTGQAINMADTRQNERYIPHSEQWPARSTLVVPMRVGLRIIGVLGAESSELNHFSPDDQQLLQTLADQTAIAIENARLFAAEQDAREQANTLREATAALTSTLELNQVLDSILTHLAQVVAFDSACVFLWDGEWLQVAAGRGSVWQEHMIGQRYPLDHHLLAEGEGTGHSLMLVSALQGLNSLHEVAGWMSVPLIVRDEVIGYLTLDSQRATAYTQAEFALAQAFANQAALAIQNARLFEQVRAGREQLQSLSHRLVERQENERRHIAREIHDEASQALTSLMVGLRLLEREADQPQLISTRVSELKRMADSVLENLHRLAMDLRPASLDYLGLVAALRQHIQSFNRQHGHLVTAQFEALGFDDERLPPLVETTLYRIAQEALTNVARHAQATQVDVLLKRRGQQLVMIVEDNGIGFDPETTLRNQRLGLVGMRERAEMLGGRLVIESVSGAGTTIYVEVPDAH
ncbi:MAG: GAF domain-containing protein [Anaerolineae bacterium]